MRIHLRDNYLIFYILGLVMRKVYDALGLFDLASAALWDNRPGKNAVHQLDGLFRQSVLGLAG